MALDMYLSSEDITTLYRSGERHTEKAMTAILTGERGNFRTDADADLYIMTTLADIMARARAFVGRIVADNVSARKPSKGIAIVARRDGRYAVIPFTEYTNDGRTYDLPTILDTEDQARNLANGLWVYNGF